MGSEQATFAIMNIHKQNETIVHSYYLLHIELFLAQHGADKVRKTEMGQLNDTLVAVAMATILSIYLDACSAQINRKDS